ncbi:universal stress protein [Gemmatimonas sp.]|uniref:universal stress protein n=1 Tax=Gemmatimonas sp. TaxID=1962908 RepID=UPI00356A6ACE
MRHATIPIVTVRPDAAYESRTPEARAEWTLRRLLVTLDGSSAAERILEPLQALVPTTVSYRLLRVISPQSQLLRALTPTSEHEGDLAEHRQRATAYLDEIKAQLEASGVSATYRIMTDTVVAHAIADGVQEPDIDLVAIATHWRGAIGRLALGSVADKVLRIADKPVMLFPVTADDAGTEPPR